MPKSRQHLGIAASLAGGEASVLLGEFSGSSSIDADASHALTDQLDVRGAVLRGRVRDFSKRPHIEGRRNPNERRSSGSIALPCSSSFVPQTI